MGFAPADEVILVNETISGLMLDHGVSTALVVLVAANVRYKGGCDCARRSIIASRRFQALRGHRIGNSMPNKDRVHIQRLITKINDIGHRLDEKNLRSLNLLGNATESL
jgi:hypothetical protein